MEICISQSFIIDNLAEKILLKIIRKKEVLVWIIFFEKSIKNLANIDDELNMIIDYYKPKAKTEYDNKNKLLVF